MCGSSQNLLRSQQKPHVQGSRTVVEHHTAVRGCEPAQAARLELLFLMPSADNRRPIVYVINTAVLLRVPAEGQEVLCAPEGHTAGESPSSISSASLQRMQRLRSHQVSLASPGSPNSSHRSTKPPSTASTSSTVPFSYSLAFMLRSPATNTLHPASRSAADCGIALRISRSCSCRRCKPKPEHRLSHPLRHFGPRKASGSKRLRITQHEARDSRVVGGWLGQGCALMSLRRRIQALRAG